MASKNLRSAYVFALTMTLLCLASNHGRSSITVDNAGRWLPFNATERRVKRTFMASELQTVAFLLGMMIYPSLSDRCLLRRAFDDASVVVHVRYFAGRLVAMCL
jgi:hypothetical protein